MAVLGPRCCEVASHHRKQAPGRNARASYPGGFHDVCARITHTHDRSKRTFGSHQTTEQVRRTLDHGDVLLVNFDDHKAIRLFDNPPPNAAARRVSGSDRPASRSVVSAILFFPCHVDDRIAICGAALATPALWRFPTGRQIVEVSRDSSSIGTTSSVPLQLGSSLTGSWSA